MPASSVRVHAGGTATYTLGALEALGAPVKQHGQVQLKNIGQFPDELRGK